MKLSSAAAADDNFKSINQQLNELNVYYGQEGYYNYQNNSVQDGNASSKGASSFNSRLKYKSDSQFRNYSWDLCELDAAALDSVLLKTDKSTLPGEYQKLSNDEIKVKVTETKRKKEEVKKEISGLTVLCEEYVNAEKAKLGQVNELENALLSSIEKVGKAKGLEFTE